MTKNRVEVRFFVAAMALALIAAACGGSGTVEGAPTQAGLVNLDESELAGMDWEEIVEAADGGTVNFFMWGGSDTINNYVSAEVGDAFKEQFNITLNRVGINDTVDAVNQVLSETEAGVFADGSVDMIWINGENFRTMKQGGLLFCDYWDVLPNAELLDQNDQTLLFDFGTEVSGCEVPWNRTQVAMIYDSATVPAPPADMDALLEFACANLGSFTYPAPPDFTGSVFVRHVFYNEADKLFPNEGGHEKLLGPFDREIYDQVAGATWATLNDIEPCLWRQGDTYPTDKTALDQLFSNSEVALNLTYEPTSVGLGVEDGLFPETTQTYGLQSGTIGNVNYTAIPYNSPNKAAALVLSNYLLDPAVQLAKADPEIWGAETVLDLTKVSAEIRADFDGLPRHPSVVPSSELAPLALPELQGDWLTTIEADWQSSVAEK